MALIKRKIGVCIDIVILVFVIVIVVVLRAGLVSLTNKPGFYCNDRSISFPVKGEMFNASKLVTTVLILPIFVILLVQVAVYRSGCTVGNYFRIFAVIYVGFLYGFACYAIFIKLLKNITGELRPNFLAICKPDYSKINCSQGYITEYTCTSDISQPVMEDAYKSFPSAHAGSAFFMATFLIIYLHKFLGPRPTVLAAAMFDVFLAVFAVFVGFLRIVEHQHHWWDVVCGAIIGIVIGVYASFLFLLKGFTTLAMVQKPTSTENEDHITEEEIKSGDIQHTLGLVQLKSETVQEV